MRTRHAGRGRAGMGSTDQSWVWLEQFGSVPRVSHPPPEPVGSSRHALQVSHHMSLPYFRLFGKADTPIYVQLQKKDG